jgi:SAM-dependent methyltransferase
VATVGGTTHAGSLDGNPCVTDAITAYLVDGTLPARQFDLVHARLVLEHLPERERVLAKLASAVRPGGWLLIEDFDWSTAMVVDPPSALHERVTHACLTLFSAHAYDPYFGRRLPRLLATAGLVEGGTVARAVQVRADGVHGLPQWELLVDQLAPGLLAQGLVDETDLERFHVLCHDGESVCFAPLMVSCWGRRTYQEDRRRSPASSRTSRTSPAAAPRRRSPSPTT